MRTSPSSLTERTASSLASETAEVHRERLSAPAADRIRDNLEIQQAHKTAPTDPHESSGSISETKEPQGVTRDSVASVASAAPAAPPALAPTSAAHDARAVFPKDLEIDFMWAEVPREMLQIFHAISPGLHQLPNLKARLRTVPGITVASSVRHSVGAVEPVSLDFNRGDRIATHFELNPRSSLTLQGTIQISVRAPDGSIRTPPPLPLNLEKGQGGIITFTGPILGLGSAPTATEIVVFILPRWGADRNP